LSYTDTSHTAQQSKRSGDTSEVTAFDIKTCSRGKWKWKGGADGSLVFARDERGIVVFGRILEFYNYTFEDRLHSCASVTWYKETRVDPATRLYTVKTGVPDEHPTLNPAVRVEDLSEPLIFAEEVDTSTLFVLDFIDRTRMVELLNWMEEM